MGALIGVPVLLLCLAIIIVMIVAFWRVFKKAGYPGWAALIPFYNAWVYYEVCGMSGAWVFANLGCALLANILPSDMWFIILVAYCFNIALSLYSGFRLGRMFGKGTSFCVFSAIFTGIAALILAFDNSEWQDPDGYDDETDTAA